MSSGHGVIKLSEADQKKLRLYPNKEYVRTTHFPKENVAESMNGATENLYIYSSPAIGEPKALVFCL